MEIYVVHTVSKKERPDTCCSRSWLDAGGGGRPTSAKATEDDASPGKMNYFSSHSEREGEAPAAWPKEGATQAQLTKRG
jgi:hypothetical protein